MIDSLLQFKQKYELSYLFIGDAFNFIKKGEYNENQSDQEALRGSH